MKNSLSQLFHQPGRRGIKTNKGCQGDLQRDLLRDPEIRLRKRYELRRSDCHRNQSNSVVERYLSAHVGKSWDAVYSEICRASRGNQLLRNELLDKVDRLVEQHVVLIDGQPYDSIGLKIVGRFSPFWVHPVTGILMASTLRPRRRYMPRKQFRQIAIDNNHRLVLVCDLWFVVTFAPIPTDETQIERDILLNEPTSSKRVGIITREWDAKVYAASKRQANKREIKRFATSSDKSISD